MPCVWPTAEDLQSFLASAHIIGGRNAIQRVAVTGAPDGGDFTLTFAGSTTSAVPYSASAADVRAALENLAGIGAGNVAVSGAAGGPWTLEFVGDLRFTTVGLITADASALTGGTDPDVVVSEIQAGVALTWSEGLIDYDSALEAAIQAFEQAVRIDPFLADGRQARSQYVQFFGDVDGGTFTLTYGGEETDPLNPLAWNATAAEVQAALELLGSIGIGNVSVIGDDGGPYTVEFSSALAPYSWLSGDASALTSSLFGTPRITVNEIAEYEDGPRARTIFLRDLWWTIDSLETGRGFGSDGALRVIHRDYEERRGYRPTRAISGIDFQGWHGGGWRSIRIIGRRGATHCLPADVFRAVMAYAAAESVLPQIAAVATSGQDVTEWRAGDVSEKYGQGGIYGQQSEAWRGWFNSIINRYRRILIAGIDRRFL